MWRNLMRLNALVVLAAADWAFGPDGCATLARSDQGTCVIRTHCQGHDTSKLEFAFVCEQHGSTVKHTFGEGGFEPEEEYDTEVKCAACDLPSAAVKAAPRRVTPATPAESNSLLHQSAASGKTDSLPPASAAFYGPHGCVATYRCPEGTCIMQTRCKQEEVAEYNFGLSCVDAAGGTSRHLFGVGSFDAVETFDTLVECQLCLGLDGELVGSTADSASLSQDVAVLKQEMKELKAGVREIKEHLGLGKAGNATAPTTPAAPTAAPVAAANVTDAAVADDAAEESADDASTDATDEAAAEDAEASDAADDASQGAFLNHRRVRRAREEPEDALEAMVLDALDGK